MARLPLPLCATCLVLIGASKKEQVLYVLISLLATEALASDIAIGVLTGPQARYRQRVLAARATWAADEAWGGPAPVVFVSEVGDDELGIEAVPDCLDVEVPRGWPSSKEMRIGPVICCVNVWTIAIALRRFPLASWIVRVNDDTFVFPNHLKQALLAFDSSQPLYLGAPSWTSSDEFLVQGQWHAAGSSGIILSRAVAELLVQRRAEFMQGCWHDDAHFGFFLNHRLGVNFHPLPGSYNVPRFSEFAGVRFTTGDLQVRICPQVLPGSVYAQPGSWGQLRGVEPDTFDKLTVLHSDPSMWPELDRLWKEVNRSGQLGRLLYYLDKDGRRIVGAFYEQAYEGRNVLSFCGLSSGARAVSWHSQASRVPRSKRVDVVPGNRWRPLRKLSALVSNATQIGQSDTRRALRQPEVGSVRADVTRAARRSCQWLANVAQNYTTASSDRLGFLMERFTVCSYDLAVTLDNLEREHDRNLDLAFDVARVSSARPGPSLQAAGAAWSAVIAMLDIEGEAMAEIGRVSRMWDARLMKHCLSSCGKFEVAPQTRCPTTIVQELREFPSAIDAFVSAWLEVLEHEVQKQPACLPARLTTVLKCAEHLTSLPSEEEGILARLLGTLAYGAALGSLTLRQECQAREAAVGAITRFFRAVHRVRAQDVVPLAALLSKRTLFRFPRPRPRRAPADAALAAVRAMCSPEQRAAAPRFESPRACISAVFLGDRHTTLWMGRTLANKQRYAKRHGHALHVLSTPLGGANAYYDASEWPRLLLGGCDVVFRSDADAVFTRGAPSLHGILARADPTSAADIILTRDDHREPSDPQHHGINMGQFFVRNTPCGNAVLQAVSTLGREGVDPYWCFGHHHAHGQDQCSFAVILGETWPWLGEQLGGALRTVPHREFNAMVPDGHFNCSDPVLHYPNCAEESCADELISVCPLE